MMRSKSKLLQSVADEFLKRTAQVAPDMTADQAKDKLKEMNTQDLLVKVESVIISDLALKNVQPTDIVFRQFSVMYPPGAEPYLNYSISFSKNIMPQVNASIAKNKVTYPNLMLSNYIRHIIQQLNPGMPAKGVVQMG